MRTSIIRKVIVALLIVPTILSAHPSLVHVFGFTHGLAHPFSGIDHLLAMIAVGIWASQMSGKAIWKLPVTFVSVMLLGGLFGISGIQIPFAEQGIITSLFVLGVLIAMAAKFEQTKAMLLVGIFALFHGYAHGAEIPADASGITYMLGFLLSTVVLHIIGIAAGIYFQKNYKHVVKYAGAAIAFTGLALFFV